MSFIAKNITQVAIRKIRPWENNPRTHSQHQVELLANSIREFGFTTPVLMKSDGTLVAGHGRVEAARFIGLEEVPAIFVDHLSERQIRALVIADNKIASLSGWDFEKLAEEISALAEAEYDLGLTGFDEQELDQLLKDDLDLLPDSFVSSPAQPARDEAQQVPSRPTETVSSGLTEDDSQVEAPSAPVTVRGDIWKLGNHRVMCGDSTNDADVAVLMDGQKADMVFTDPPYNVRISGLGGSGLDSSISAHGEFVMASGEMSETEFTDFLKDVFSNLKSFSRDGAIHYICMDWRHMREMMNAGQVYEDSKTESGELKSLKQLIVWNKDRAGMGTFYRSKHELIFVFKVGNGKHTNNFELGQHGRFRSNVWDYPMVLTFMHRADEGEGNTKMHPTVKPVVMIVDACLDCSMPGDIVLDLFGGSGSTMIACEKTDRHSRLMELDPKYCDVMIKRWQDFTGKEAVHVATGKTFEEIMNERN